MRKRKFNILIHVTAVIIGVIFIFPVLWLVLSAFKPGSELFTFPLTFFPKHFTFDNFITAWKKMDFMLYTLNTVFVTIMATVLTLLLSAMCGFALAKYHYKWLNILFICVLATTMLPTEVIMTPSFEVIRVLGLYNSLWGLIIPTIGTMTGIFLMRQFFVTVPDALIEAARIDGASEGKIFIKIMLPVAKSTLAILAIFSFRWRWNDYIWPLIVIDDPQKYTLQLALKNLAGALSIDWTTLLSASVITMLPILLVFVLCQKRIINANTSSGVK
ncbi:carbohydrate ABC transporter permease [uncultured Robinsoniella sp.]|uniref:carbohydrate ABC transporter permease n=1 Tax=uncultured Robinsoniella sp. TaxID=904190 RepID=UPI00374E87B5